MEIIFGSVPRDEAVVAIMMNMENLRRGTVLGMPRAWCSWSIRSPKLDKISKIK